MLGDCQKWNYRAKEIDVGVDKRSVKSDDPRPFRSFAHKIVTAGWRLFFVVTCLSVGACRSEVNNHRQSRNQANRIVASTRSEPQTFNRLVSSTRPVGLVSTLVHDTLLRVN